MIRPGRVLITTDAVGGVWRYTVDLVGELDRASIACLLVGAGPEPDAARAGECDGWRRSDIVWTPHPLDWMTGDPDALEAARDDLERRARDWRADLLHLHSPSQAAGLSRDRPVAVVSHSCQATWCDAVGYGRMPDEWSASIGRMRAGFARADRILVPTNAHAEALERAYGPLDRTTIVANAVTPHEDAAGKEPFVLAAGRWWDPGKNGRALDRAAARTTWPVRMAGPLLGPEGSAFSLEHAVALGEMPNAELRGLMARASIFASPSLYEPFGLAVLEAASHHCALVLADIPTLRELWAGAAVFADPGDPDSFARAIERLSSDEAERVALATAARRIARRFTPERQLAAVLAAYEHCLALTA